MKIISNFVLVTVCCLFGTLANGHEIHLKGGRVIQVAAYWEKKDNVWIEKYGGRVSISKDRVKKIVNKAPCLKSTPTTRMNDNAYSEGIRPKDSMVMVNHNLITQVQSTRVSKIMPGGNPKIFGKKNIEGTVRCKDCISTEQLRTHKTKKSLFKHGKETRSFQDVVRPIDLCHIFERTNNLAASR